ncbi:MAG: ATP-binding protein [bacterium]|nr:ATP-binding protein [bacterium]
MNFDKKIILSRARNYIQRISKLSGEIIGNIPNLLHDNLPTQIIKGISLINTSQEFIYGKRGGIDDYLSQFKLEKESNQSFVLLIFSNLVIESLQVKRIPIGSNTYLIKIDVCGNGTLYFTEHKYDQRPEKDDEFYYSPDFDFKSLMAQIWNLYSGRIYVTLNSKDVQWNGGSWVGKPNFNTFHISNDPIYGSALDLFDKINEKNIRCRADGVSRSYLFFGPPGTGKSSFAQKLGGDKKIIKFDAKSFESISVESIKFLFSVLSPEFVIIDDIDKVFAASGEVATLLCILETIKLDFPQSTIIVTANSVDELDPAIFRAGRLDEPIKFAIQNAEDRREILTCYGKKLDIKISDEQIEKIISATEGLSAAYMKEIIIQMKYSSMEEVLNIIKTMKSLLKKKK